MVSWVFFALPQGLCRIPQRGSEAGSVLSFMFRTVRLVLDCLVCVHSDGLNKS